MSCCAVTPGGPGVRPVHIERGVCVLRSRGERHESVRLGQRLRFGRVVRTADEFATRRKFSAISAARKRGVLNENRRSRSLSHWKPLDRFFHQGKYLSWWRHTTLTKLAVRKFRLTGLLMIMSADTLTLCDDCRIVVATGFIVIGNVFLVAFGNHESKSEERSRRF